MAVPHRHAPLRFTLNHFIIIGGYSQSIKVSNNLPNANLVRRQPLHESVVLCKKNEMLIDDQ
jgi:hypothetical protein